METEADSVGEEQLRKLGEEEEEKATEWRREYSDLGLDLGESDDKAPAMPQPWLVLKQRCKPGDLQQTTRL